MRLPKIDALQRALGRALPPCYAAFLGEWEEGLCGGQVLPYGADSLMERNATYETQLSCPGFIAIGDDSGGRAVMLALDGASTAVYLVGHGSMQRDDFEPAADDFTSWLAADCPLD